MLRQAKSESQVFKEFITNWDSEKPEAIISFEEFLSYYTVIFILLYSFNLLFNIFFRILAHLLKEMIILNI